ncbi:hypothetical protein [Streptomyces kanasensis]|uniref:hypothetical protein n=1 Tax=Streptomyces kanasensis TaxID=936756 RepID=UPI0036FBBB9A
MTRRPVPTPLPPRPRRAPALLAALASPLLLLVGCGTQVAGSAVPDRAELEARAAALQTRAEHVYVTEAAGFALAEQSVGVLGDDGFSASYVSKGGGTLTLGVERGRLEDVGCAATPSAAPAPSTGAGAAGGAPCAADGALWYRSGDTAHEYLRVEGGLRIRVSADRAAVDRATLRAAAERAHRASDEELAEVLPERAPGTGDSGATTGSGGTGRTGGTAGNGGPGGAPVERGDLPPVGDGAPDNGVGVSG